MAWFTTTLTILYNKSCCRAKQTLERYAKALECYTKRLYRFLHLSAQQHPLLAQACYFTSISLVGLAALKSLPFKGHAKLKNVPATDLDLFFTSVSAATVSSMSTVEMEVFSEAQLAVLTLLMLAGGEVLLSAITLHFTNKMLPPVYKQQQLPPVDLVTIYVDTKADTGDNTTIKDYHPNTDTNTDQVEPIGDGNQQLEPPAAAAAAAAAGRSVENHHHPPTDHLSELRCNAMKSLAGVYRTYLLFMHIAGSLSVLIYLLSVSDARGRLREKGIRMSTFAVFTTVSSFSNCGFIPTNENMMVFSNNSGLLLIIIPQILLGNTLFPPCLRLCLWLLERLTKRAEYGYLLKNWTELEVGGSHPADHYYLLPYTHTLMLVYTVVSFILIQTVAILSMEWRSPQLAGMDSSYQKLVAALFMSVNSRHAGESVFDLSTLSEAVLVIFVIMMYLPPYTTCIPIEEERLTSNIGTDDKGRPGLVRRLDLSELSYIALAIILICITEREKLKRDPLNFNVFNIVIEVISAYANVGFSTGYSCKRQLEPNRDCQDRWYGFVGKWSSQGKLILILVMFIGKLKKFSRTGGKAWKLH